MPLEDSVNPLECKGNYGGTSNNMKLVHWWVVTFGTAKNPRFSKCNSPPINQLYESQYCCIMVCC